jgi:SAM-dependent methyltransferase
VSDAADRDWAAVFTKVFAEPGSAVHARVLAAVLGEEYPVEVAPYSFTTRSELTRIAREVRLAPGELLVDVGCGRGGPGLWVAVATGASYLGVDITSSPLAEVQHRASRIGIADRVRTAVGAFDNLPVSDGEAGAVISIDALLFAPSKHAALREVSRALRPAGRLVLTTWDYSRQPAGRPPQVADHRPLLQAAGLRVLAYDETPEWERRQREITRLLAASVSELAAEIGSDPDAVRAQLGEAAATIDAMLRRVLIVAQRA